MAGQIGAQILQPSRKVDRVGSKSNVSIGLRNRGKTGGASDQRRETRPRVVRDVDLRFQFQQPSLGFRVALVVTVSLGVLAAPAGGDSKLI